MVEVMGKKNTFFFRQNYEIKKKKTRIGQCRWRLEREYSTEHRIPHSKKN